MDEVTEALRIEMAFKSTIQATWSDEILLQRGVLQLREKLQSLGP